jgi:hypothetical protein
MQLGAKCGQNEHDGAFFRRSLIRSIRLLAFRSTNDFIRRSGGVHP